MSMMGTSQPNSSAHARINVLRGFLVFGASGSVRVMLSMNLRGSTVGKTRNVGCTTSSPMARNIPCLACSTHLSRCWARYSSEVVTPLLYQKNSNFAHGVC